MDFLQHLSFGMMVCRVIMTIYTLIMCISARHRRRVLFLLHVMILNGNLINAMASGSATLPP